MHHKPWPFLYHLFSSRGWPSCLLLLLLYLSLLSMLDLVNSEHLGGCPTPRLCRPPGPQGLPLPSPLSLFRPVPFNAPSSAGNSVSSSELCLQVPEISCRALIIVLTFKQSAPLILCPHTPAVPTSSLQIPNSAGVLGTHLPLLMVFWLPACLLLHFP